MGGYPHVFKLIFRLDLLRKPGTDASGARAHIQHAILDRIRINSRPEQGKSLRAVGYALFPVLELLRRNSTARFSKSGKWRESIAKIPDVLVSTHCGSFNVCVRLHWDDDGPDWLIRFQIPGKTVFADEKLRGEIAVIKLVRQNTSIPVPEIITYGSAAENPTRLGPFIVMTWLEGVRMKELMEKKVCSPDRFEETLLDPELDANALITLNREFSGILCQLWTLEFDKIGSVDFNSDSNSWEVKSRPITLGMNELVRYGGINEENLACGTFESSLDYVFHLCEMRELHFMKQRNSVHDSRDCRAKYTCRRLLKSAATLFTSKRDINGLLNYFAMIWGLEISW
ncbi:hypothetical protein LOZ58_003687 [Ophidiomyces ophidiicola]|nr:hypothetical protein LOZ58_003687 [Ophidiomyces ophidiicola]